MMITSIKFNNMQELQAYLMNPANYKPARKKSYTIWACMPAIGTKVHNILEDANYVTNEQKRFVLSGTRGEMWTIDVNKMAKTYTLGDGTPITPQALKSKQQGDVIDWFQVKTITTGNVSLHAIFVPVQYQFQVQTSWGETLIGNRPGIPHGKGDFVLCGNNNGQPNLNDRWIVNGAVFADTYDNRGWVDYLDTSHILNGAPQKPTTKVVTGGANGNNPNSEKQQALAAFQRVIAEVDKIGCLFSQRSTEFVYRNKDKDIYLYVELANDLKTVRYWFDTSSPYHSFVHTTTVQALWNLLTTIHNSRLTPNSPSIAKLHSLLSPLKDKADEANISNGHFYFCSKSRGGSDYPDDEISGELIDDIYVRYSIYSDKVSKRTCTLDEIKERVLKSGAIL